MNKSLIFMSFTLGATIATFITWRLLKKKYSDLNEEEIESVRKYYKEKFNDTNQDVEEIKPEAESARTADDILKNYCPGGVYEVEEVVAIITPEEFAASEYETISLTYYSDGVLADEDDDEITNISEIVGDEFISYLNNCKDDSVFVRNNKLKCDYEILYDVRKYKDILKTMPPKPPIISYSR